jgi:hypothetical protein
LLSAIPGTGSGTINTYQWLKNGINISSATGSTYSATASATYSLQVTYSGGCTITSAGLIVTMNPLPVLSIQATPSSTICPGSSLVLTAAGAATYTWTGGISNGISFIPSATTTYTVTGTSSAGCTSTASQLITLLPLTSLSTSQTNVSCKGGSNGIASVSASGGAKPYAYLWSNGKAGSSISSLKASSYTVTVTDANSCSVNSVVTITEPKSAVSVTISGSFSGGSLTANPSGGTPGYTYKWNTGATTQSINISSHGTYTVTVTDLNKCIASTNKTVKLGDDDQPGAAELFIYPNPSIGDFFIEMNIDTEENSPAEIQIFNSIGQLIYKKQTSTVDGKLREEVKLSSSLVKGNYFLTVILNDQVIKSKIIIQ